MKKALLIGVIIFLMMGVCGCGMKKQSKVDKMMEYINNKYTDDTFTYVGVTGGYLGSNVKKILVKSNLYPDEEIVVICTETNGSDVFTDTYLNIKFKDLTYAYIEERIKEKFGKNIYINYYPDDLACTENGSKDTTFEEYLSGKGTYIYFYAVVCGPVEDQDIETEDIKKMFKDAVIEGSIYYVNQNIVLTGDEGRKNAIECVEKKMYTQKLYFEKSSLDEYEEVKWMEAT